nr:hypothetical protein [uncultured Carboxylicivirga sp.]
MGIVYLSPYTGDPNKHGGEKRTYQIKTLLKDECNIQKLTEYSSLFIPFSLKNQKLTWLKNFIKGCLIASKINSPIKFKFVEFVKLNQAFFYYKSILTQHPKDTIIWDYGCGNPNSWDFLIPYIKSKDQKLIAIIHNLDSLIDGRYLVRKSNSSPKWFNSEINILKKCNHTITISREEYWLLKLYKINSSFLSYFPIKEVKKVCLKIKETRVNTSKNGFLILGSTVNKPTYEAHRTLINKINCTEKVYVAGYGSENLKGVSDNKNINILGTLSQEDLEIVLSKVKGVIVYSQPTTGALTKIPELVTSGIPVFVNDIGARSYNHLKELYVYNDFNHLNTILNKNVSDIHNNSSNDLTDVAIAILKQKL